MGIPKKMKGRRGAKISKGLSLRKRIRMENKTMKKEAKARRKVARAIREKMIREMPLETLLKKGDECMKEMGTYESVSKRCDELIKQRKEEYIREKEKTEALRLKKLKKMGGVH